MTKNRAAIELVFAGVLWGFGFAATVWAMQAFTPTETLVYRFIAATVIGEIIYLVVKGPALRSAKEDFLRALPAGAILGTMLLLQAIGLKYTTATKSGFITSLYVILVPLFNAWFFKSPNHWRNYALAAVALLGTFILMDADLAGVNTGDLWTVACSILAAFHIIYIGKVSTKVGNAFRFNNFQSFWSLVVLTPLLFFQDSITWKVTNMEAWAGVLALGLGSSIVAFYLQVRTQRILTDTTASMLFLLESPFAALFGFLLLQERLSLFQTAGAVVIMIASILQILWDPSSKTTGKPQEQ
ncbi:DMT family transporter [Bdellovibrio svalbardensis]|uniref:DMT family transporter n=1 Tax=Bdellovibrio svalbardensis TaxID=2972972 RepID=A0ABT6DJV8_9BACT|nr:DMT family transporter [Bdellovibrio svalbardensis]MDG0816136.1 DMT family transporter [Bdellovibrio svalbardensis]